MVSMIYGITFFAVLKAVFNFSAQKKVDEIGKEGYHRLLSIFSKNKFGYNTRFMSDFDVFLESALNEKFVDESVKYYDDPYTAKEVEDVEAGLNGDFNHADVRNLLKDKAGGHHDSFKSLMNPDRVGTNYPRSDALSCYKIMPKGEMPKVWYVFLHVKFILSC